MTTLYEGAFAKLNLTLDVLDKRPDGYHDIKSVMQTVSLRDDVEIDIGTGEPWSLLCSVEGIPPMKQTWPGRQPSCFSTPLERIPTVFRSGSSSESPLAQALAEAVLTQRPFSVR